MREENRRGQEHLPQEVVVRLAKEALVSVGAQERLKACACQVCLRDNKIGQDLLGGDGRVEEGGAVARG